MGDLFADAGYRYGMIGPWHLGDDELPQHGFTHTWKPYKYAPDHDAYLAHLAEHGLVDAYLADADRRFFRDSNRVAPTHLPTAHQRTSWVIGEAITFYQSALRADQPSLTSQKSKRPLQDSTTNDSLPR